MSSLDPMLDSLFVTNASVIAAAVLGADGRVLASRGPSDGVLASLGSALAVVAGRTVTELGRGALGSVVVEGDDGFVLIVPIDDASVLAAVAHRGAAPGLLLSDLRAAVRAGARVAA